MVTGTYLLIGLRPIILKKWETLFFGEKHFFEICKLPPKNGYELPKYIVLNEPVKLKVTVAITASCKLNIIE